MNTTGETIANNFCANTANIWHLLGLVLLILKIVIPIILIVLGMIDLGKAVISSEEKQISKSVTTLAKRLVAAIVIFFIPTIISVIWTAVISFSSEEQKNYDVCKKCITSPSGTVCKGAMASFNGTN